MYTQSTSYEQESLQKIKQALHDVISLMQKEPSSTLTDDTVKQIQMRFQAPLIDLKKAKVQIPYIALQPKKPQSLNTFNKRQLELVEKQVQGYNTMIQNFGIVCQQIQVYQKTKKQMKESM